MKGKVLTKEKKEIKKEDKKLNIFLTYSIYFFIFSFLGWLMETVYAICVLGHFVKRGFLYGPLCPIYGYGALMLIIFLGKYKNNGIKLFAYAGIIFSVFEYIVSYVLEVLFGMYWWNYTGEFLNINGRITLSFSLAWGIIALLLIKFIYPFIKRIVEYVLSKVPHIAQLITVISLLSVYIVDTILSFIRYL